MNWYLNATSREMWAYAEKAFSPEECDAIIEIGKKIGFDDSKVNNEEKLKLNVRKSKVCFLNPKDRSVEWIYRRATDFVNDINRQFWNYDLSYIETLQFTAYTQKDDFYDKHVDQALSGPFYRKLSFSIQLSDPDTYEGSDLLMYASDDPVNTRRNRGAMIFFPSFVVHKVTPLVSGERYSLVGWVCGPPFK